MLQRKLDVLFPEFAVVVLEDFMLDGKATAVRYEADERIDIEALEKEIRSHSVPEDESDIAVMEAKKARAIELSEIMTLHNIKNGLKDLPEWKRDIEKRLAALEKGSGDGKARG